MSGNDHGRGGPGGPGDDDELRAYEAGEVGGAGDARRAYGPDGSALPEGPDGPERVDGSAAADGRSAHRRRPRTLAKVTHGFGEVLLTIGVVMLLFVGYTLWWTGVETGNAQDQLRDELVEEWENPQPGQPLPTTPVTPGATEEPQELARPEIGDAVGVLRIPRFGPGYAWVVVEGVDLDNLARGPGHYPSTSLPGEIGNFAVAGHRATHGEPFAQFEALEDGDEVVVETASQWFTYTITEIQYPVPVTSGWAIDPNPLDLGVEPTKAMLTLTTCHPRWASTHRFLVFSELTNTTPKLDASGNEQLPPALAGFEA